MQKTPKFETRLFPVLTVAAIALAALLVYVFLLRQWQAPVAASSSAMTADAAMDQAPLELSRRLSNVESTTAPAEVTYAGTTPSLLGPLLGFFCAFGAGAVAGRILWRRPDAESVAPPTVPTQPATESVSDAPADQPQPAARPMAQAADTDTLPDPDGALRARDNVIASLEGIVSENRETWGEFERERDAMRDTIASLQADLAASNAIIEDMHRDARRGQSIEDEQAAVGHQVLQRA